MSRGSRPAYSKTTPCSRTTHLQKQIRNGRTLVSTQPSQSAQQVLQSILKLMQDSTFSFQKKLQELFQLLSVMPPWSQWSPQADSVVGSTFTGLKSEHGPYEQKDPALKEEIASVLLATELIALNGNMPMVTYKTLESCDERFRFVFLQWLHGAHSPDDDKRHVQDEYGAWLTDSQLRTYMKDGAELHVPTRTVGAPFDQRDASITFASFSDEAL